MILMRSRHGNRPPRRRAGQVAAPARPPRAQRAPLLPQVAARAGRARSRGHAHSGRLGASRGRQVRWAAGSPRPPPVGVSPGAPE
uniref:Uncharacterized protein n=1 Tax=Rangifer tarandus platyrhynchus TaxID=3082113 RepID=A0ACB0EQQ1_RANTA|nr:unnamed protein product [Rangifer tarandus platyrhynchus]